MVVFDWVLSKQPKVKDASCDRLVADIEEKGLKVNLLKVRNQKWEAFLPILYCPLLLRAVLDLFIKPLAVEFLNSFEDVVMT